MTISNSYISYGSQIVCDSSGTLKIQNSFVGRNCNIVSKEEILIQSNCLIAEMVVIRDQDHDYSNGAERKNNEFKTGPIEIKEGAWLASKATVLKNVTIGQNSVLGASSVAVRSIPDFQLWAGIPSRFIKNLKQEP